jgi:hypothetical protein
MMTRSRSLTLLLSVGLLCFVAGLTLADPNDGGAPRSGEGDLGPAQGETDNQDATGVPATPDDPPPASDASLFPDADTLTTISVTTTIGPGCELELWDDNFQKRHYGPGESVHLEIRRGYATVNDVRVHYPLSAPTPDRPLARLQRDLSSIPFVQEYVRTHDGSPHRVWNDANTAYDAALQSLHRRAWRLHQALDRAGLPITQVADSLRRLYLSSPIITDATAFAWRDAVRLIELRYKTHATNWTVSFFSDHPQRPRETPPVVLTKARASKLLAVAESLRGDNGPVAWRIARGGPTPLYP